jgi:ABC-2 type transport system ATP-binding protein
MTTVAVDERPAEAAVAPPVAVDGLGKTYGEVVAVDEVSLQVAAGEAVGLLGPNGAGKTTTVKILVGLTHPSAGHARVFGAAPTDPVARSRLGYLPELFRFPEWLSGREVLEVHARLAGMEPRARRRRILEVLEQVGLAGRGDERVRTYSKGMTQRLGLAQALVARPALVLLDEPTSGLDPLMAAVFQDVVRESARDGRTVLLSSHILAEVEALCDRVSIIRAGRLVESGTLAELRHLTRSSVAFARVPGQEDELAALEGVHDLSVEDGRVQFTVDSDRIAEVLPELGRLGVAGLTIAPPSLEELFLRHYGDDPALLGQGARP